MRLPLEAKIILLLVATAFPLQAFPMFGEDAENHTAAAAADKEQQAERTEAAGRRLSDPRGETSNAAFQQRVDNPSIAEQKEEAEALRSESAKAKAGNGVYDKQKVWFALAIKSFEAIIEEAQKKNANQQVMDLYREMGKCCKNAASGEVSPTEPYRDTSLLAAASACEQAVQEARKPEYRKQVIALYKQSSDFYKQAAFEKDREKAYRLDAAGLASSKAAQEAEQENPSQESINLYSRLAALHKQAEQVVSNEDLKQAEQFLLAKFPQKPTKIRSEKYLSKIAHFGLAADALNKAAQAAQNKMVSQEVKSWSSQSADFCTEAISEEDPQKAYRLRALGFVFGQAAEAAQDFRRQHVVGLYVEAADLYKEAIKAASEKAFQKANYLDFAANALERQAQEAKKATPNKSTIDVFSREAADYKKRAALEKVPEKAYLREAADDALEQAAQAIQGAEEAKNEEANQKATDFSSQILALNKQAAWEKDCEKAIRLMFASHALRQAREEAEKQEANQEVVDFYSQAADLHKQAAFEEDPEQASRLGAAAAALFQKTQAIQAAEEAKKQDANPQVADSSSQADALDQQVVLHQGNGRASLLWHAGSAWRKAVEAAKKEPINQDVIDYYKEASVVFKEAAFELNSEKAYFLQSASAAWAKAAEATENDPTNKHMIALYRQIAGLYKDAASEPNSEKVASLACTAYALLQQAKEAEDLYRCAADLDKDAAEEEDPEQARRLEAAAAALFQAAQDPEKKQLSDLERKAVALFKEAVSQMDYVKTYELVTAGYDLHKAATSQSSSKGAPQPDQEVIERYAKAADLFHQVSCEKNPQQAAELKTKAFALLQQAEKAGKSQPNESIISSLLSKAKAAEEKAKPTPCTIS